MGTLTGYSSKAAREAADKWLQWLPHGRLVVFNSHEIGPFCAESFEASWINQSATAELVADVYGLVPNQVLRELSELARWAERQEKKERTLFALCRFVKRMFRDSWDRHEPDELSYSHWIPQVVHELLLTVGGFVDDFDATNGNGMTEDAADLALEWDRLWHEVKFAEEETLLSKCAYESRMNPKHYHPSPTYNRFLNLARCLQQSQGDQPILLPQFPVAEVLGVSQSIVSNLTRRAVRERFLVRLEDASFNRRRAARFRFIETR